MPDGTGPTPGGARTFRRSAGTRALSTACAALLVGGAVWAATAPGPRPALVPLAVLAVLSLLNLVTAWGDRYTFDDAGIEYRNAALAALRRRGRRIAWDDVMAVREHRRLRAGGLEDRPTALFLTVRSGRRLVLDALEDFDAVRQEVRRRCGGG